MQWADVNAYLANYLQQEPAIADYTAAVPLIIANAELRIYRELDFLSTRGVNSSLSFTAGARTLSMAAMTGTLVSGFPVANVYPVVVQSVAAILPTATQPNAGQRVRFQLASYEFVDALWPNESVVSPPGTPFAYYALVDHQTVIVAPTPDQSYVAEIIGTWRPAPMSATNIETWLGDNLPDLFFAACMVEAAGWERDFGRQADDPQMAMSWEGEYGRLKASAIEEEQRRKGFGAGYQPFSPTPLAAGMAGPRSAAPRG
jgi:hypothetical protein